MLARRLANDCQRTLVVEHESRTITVRRQVRGTGRLTEEQNDQVDCCCWLRLIGCDIGASYDTCADSSAGRHNQASRSLLRRWQDKGERAMRGKNHRPSDPPRRPQVCNRDHLLAPMLSNRRRLETVPVWTHAAARADSRWRPAAHACISGSARNVCKGAWSDGCPGRYSLRKSAVS